MLEPFFVREVFKVWNHFCGSFLNLFKMRTPNHITVLEMWSHMDNFGSILLSKAAKERLINPKTEFAFFMAADEWLWDFNLWSVITSKSFTSFTFVVGYNTQVIYLLYICGRL